MTSSSTGFIGLAAVRYFPSEITPLASINDVSGGFDVINKYTLSIGAGSTSSTFFYPYTNTTLGSTFITFGTICDVLNYLNLLMGQIQLQTNLDVSIQKGVSTYTINMNFQYTYNDMLYTVQAQFPNGQCTVSTKVLLPIPIIIGEPCINPEELGLASYHLPCYIVIDRNADSLNSLASSGSSATLIPLSGYIVTDMSFIPSSFSQTHYSLAISDVNSTLKTPFTFNRTVYSTIINDLGPRPSDMKANIVILGGFTASLQYQGGNPPAGTTTIASSVNNTLGSVILQNV